MNWVLGGGMWLISCPSHLSIRKCPCCPKSKRLGVPHRRSGHCGVTTDWAMPVHRNSEFGVFLLCMQVVYSRRIFQLLFLPVNAPQIGLKTLVSSFQYKTQPCVIIVFFEDFFRMLSYCYDSTLHFTLQPSTNAVQHGSQSCYNYV
jgi:hypothetical protein